MSISASRIPPGCRGFPDSPVLGYTGDSLITYVEDRPGHDTRYAINAEKIMTELGYQPVEDFESGLNKTVDWYLANEAWWQSILGGSAHLIALLSAEVCFPR